MSKSEIVYKEESYKIIGSCMTVHNALGAGFLEPVYQDALEKQFEKDKIHFRREQVLNIFYEGDKLNRYYKADFVCFEKIIVELKALSFIHNDNILQVRNYLRATNMHLGILVNFGERSLTYKRILNSNYSY